MGMGTSAMGKHRTKESDADAAHKPFPGKVEMGKETVEAERRTLGEQFAFEIDDQIKESGY